MRAKVISVVAILMFYVFLYWSWLGNGGEIYSTGEISAWAAFGSAISVLASFYGLGYLCYLCIRWVMK